MSHKACVASQYSLQTLGRARMVAMAGVRFVVLKLADDGCALTGVQGRRFAALAPFAP